MHLLHWIQFLQPQDQHCSFPRREERTIEIDFEEQIGLPFESNTFMANSMCWISTFDDGKLWFCTCEAMLFSHSFCSGSESGCSCSARNVLVSLNMPMEIIKMWTNPFDGTEFNYDRVTNPLSLNVVAISLHKTGISFILENVDRKKITNQQVTWIDVRASAPLLHNFWHLRLKAEVGCNSNAKCWPFRMEFVKRKKNVDSQSYTRRICFLKLQKNIPIPTASVAQRHFRRVGEFVLNRNKCVRKLTSTLTDGTLGRTVTTLHGNTFMSYGILVSDRCEVLIFFISYDYHFSFKMKKTC